MDTNTPAEQPKQTAPVKPTPPPVQSTAAKPAGNPSSAGVIVLQWLTYAFWGWLLLAFLWLLVTILSYFIVQGSSSDSMLNYAIASVVILLPVATICDFFYAKKEPLVKSGAAMVVMVIHAVLFALLAIGTLVAGVIITLSRLTENLSVSSQQLTTVWIIALFIMAALYAATLLRTLGSPKKLPVSRIYTVGMLVIIIGLLVTAFAAPFAASIASRSDRLIEQNLPNADSAIGEYVRDRQQLPDSLNQLVDGSQSYYQEDLEMLIAKDVVRYQPVGLATSNDSSVYRYKLCVTYKQENKNRSSYGSYYDSGYDTTDADGYSSGSLSRLISNHGAGEVCYKRQVPDPAMLKNPSRSDVGPSTMQPDVRIDSAQPEL